MSSTTVNPTYHEAVMRKIRNAAFTIWFQSLLESPLQFRPWSRYCDDDAPIAHILTTRWCTLHRHENFIRQVVDVGDTESFIRQVALDFASSYNESVPDLAPYDDELARLRTMQSFDPTALADTDSEDESIPDLISDPDDSDYDDGLFIHPPARFVFRNVRKHTPVA